MRHWRDYWLTQGQTREPVGRAGKLKLFLSVPLRDPEHKQALSAWCCPDFCQSAELSLVSKGLFSKWCASCVEHPGPLFVPDKCDVQGKHVSFQDNGLQSIADQNKLPVYYEGLRVLLHNKMDYFSIQSFYRLTPFLWEMDADYHNSQSCKVCFTLTLFPLWVHMIDQNLILLSAPFRIQIPYSYLKAMNWSYRWYLQDHCNQCPSNFTVFVSQSL